MRDLGRLASALAMLLAPCIFLFYIDMTLLNPIWIGGLISGALLFSLFPKALLEKYGGLRETEGPQDRYTKMKELTEEKLLGVSARLQGWLIPLRERLVRTAVWRISAGRRIYTKPMA